MRSYICKVSESVVWLMSLPRQDVGCITNPEIIKEYLFGTETVTDWKVGNDIIFQGEYHGHKYRDHGVIKENIPHRRIAYSYWSGFSGLEDKPENYSMVIYHIEPLMPHIPNSPGHKKDTLMKHVKLIRKAE